MPAIGLALGLQYGGVSGFSPKKISGLKIWLDAQSQSLGTVSTWADKSGAGNNATQGTAGFRPVNTANEIYGRNAVVFDGVDDYLSATFGSTLSQPITFFLVTKRTSGTTFLDGVGAVNRAAVLSDAGQSNKTTLYSGSNATTTSTTTALPVLYSGLFSGASSELRENGGANVISTSPGTAGIDGVTIGADYSGANTLSGSVAEVIYYTRALSSTERQKVEEFLRSKYDLYPPASGNSLDFSHNWNSGYESSIV
jgi:hypothetical protein